MHLYSFTLFRGACSFCKSSVKRIDVLKCTIEELTDSCTSKTNLTSLCTTRFIKRHTAVVTFRCLPEYILVALDKISFLAVVGGTERCSGA